MKTQYYVASSLDGFIATEDHRLDWLNQFDDVDETSYTAFIKDVGAIAMGSATYEWVLRNQDQLPQDANGAAVWPYEQPTWVFTTRALVPFAGADIRFVSGDVRPVYQQMADAAQGGNIWLIGGGELVGQFYDHGLLDELIVHVTPVTLGRGMPLLPRRITSPPLKLLSAQRMGGAFAELRYAVINVEKT